VSQDGVRLYLTQQLLRLFPELPDPDYTARIIFATGRELLYLRLTDPEATNERLRSVVRHLRTLTVQD
jgi:hypothetical protein